MDVPQGPCQGGYLSQADSHLAQFRLARFPGPFSRPVFPGKITEKRERGALGLLLHPELSSRAPIYQRSTGRSSPSRGLHEAGASPPDVPNRLFRGRPVYSNSIFVDGAMLFPQMDVWSRWLHCAVGPSFNGSNTANRSHRHPIDEHASGNPSVRSRERSVFP